LGLTAAENSVLARKEPSFDSPKISIIFSINQLQCQLSGVCTGLAKMFKAG